MLRPGRIAACLLIVAALAALWRWIPTLETERLADQLRQRGGVFGVSEAGKIVWLRFPPETGDDDIAILRNAANVRHLNLAGTQVTDAGLERLGVLPHLDMLDLSEMPRVTRGFEFAGRCTALRELRANDNRWVDDEQVRHLQGLSQLHTLHIANTAVTDSSAAVLARLPSLVHLRLDECPGVGDATLKQVAPLERLKWFSATGSKVTWKEWEPAWRQRPNVFAAHNPLSFADYRELRDFGVDFSGYRTPEDDDNLDTFSTFSDRRLIIRPELPERLIHRVADFRGLRSLAVENPALTDELVIACLKRSPNLRYLALSGSPVTERIIPHLRNCRLLIALDLSETRIAGSGVHEFPPLPQMRWLHLAGLDLRGADLSTLANAPALQDLELGDSIVGHSIRTLPPLESLHSLSLDGTDLDDRALATLPAMPNLLVLRLNETQISGSTLPHLEAYPKLEALSLLRCDQLEPLHLGALKNLTSLEWLSVGPDFNDDHLIAMAGSSVTGLTIVDPRLTDVGASALSDLSSLTMLFLRGEVPAELINALSDAEHLKTVSLDDARFNPAAIEQLRARRPDLEVYASPMNSAD